MAAADLRRPCFFCSSKVGASDADEPSPVAARGVHAQLFARYGTEVQGGERPGVGGRGWSNKVPIVAAGSTDELGHPLWVKLNAVAGFTTEGITTWARTNLTTACDVRSDLLWCFAGVIHDGCAHSRIVVGRRLPRGPPQFEWVNTVLGNL